MPWTPKQTRYLLSKGSPLTADQKAKMEAELHADPSLAHAKKQPDTESHVWDHRKRSRPKHG